MNIATKNYTFADLTKNMPDRQERAQLQLLYDLASGFEQPNILELGTQGGVSTTVFLQACQERNGRLTSVDINDCSSISDDKNFHFVQSNSTDASYILDQAPQLRRGIDLLYVDTLHQRQHVHHELRSWWPWLKLGSIVIFDDIDPHVYRPGQLKDKVGIEINNEQIAALIEAIFRQDMDNLELAFTLGGSGKAVLRKFTPMGQDLPQVKHVRKRSGIRRVLRKIRTRDWSL